MPGAFDLTKEDALVGTNFFLEIDGSIVSNLTSVDGLSLEIEKSDINQRLKDGKLAQHVAMSKPKMTGELTVKRLAPLDATSDEMWKWFNSLRDKGMSANNRSSERKDGSVVIYDTTFTEIGRWNFYKAWPSKMAMDSFEVTKNDPVAETITIQYEKLERKK
jgi:phage tail-like protein